MDAREAGGAVKQRSRRSWCRPTVPAKFWRLKHFRPSLASGEIGAVDQFTVLLMPEPREVITSLVCNPEKW
jgi:hypothetical protein